MMSFSGWMDVFIALLHSLLIMGSDRSISSLTTVLLEDYCFENDRPMELVSRGASSEFSGEYYWCGC